MATYLLTWNPSKFDWSTFSSLARKVASGKKYEDSWSVVNKHIVQGDRIFMLRQGVEPRGVFASGWAASDPYVAAHWSGSGRPARYVDVRYETLLDIVKQPEIILERKHLVTKALAKVHWTTQSSGIEIPPPAASELERVWARHLESLGRRPASESSPSLNVGVSTLDGIADDQLELPEGGLLPPTYVRHRKREGELRRAKIDAAVKSGVSLRCEVSGCGFDFSVYGDLGRRYAQVHHLAALADSSAFRTTSLKDLAIVCANCHVMIHRGGQCRSLWDIERAIAASVPLDSTSIGAPEDFTRVRLHCTGTRRQYAHGLLSAALVNGALEAGAGKGVVAIQLGVIVNGALASEGSGSPDSPCVAVLSGTRSLVEQVTAQTVANGEGQIEVAQGLATAVHLPVSALVVDGGFRTMRLGTFDTMRDQSLGFRGRVLHPLDSDRFEEHVRLPAANLLDLPG